MMKPVVMVSAASCFLLLLATTAVVVVTVSNAECPYAHDHHHVHDHDHEHHEEPVLDSRPSFKYSREANDVLPQSPAGHSGSSHDHHDHGHDHAPTTSPSPSSSVTRSVGDIWMQALGSTILISLAPFLVLFLIPVSDSVTDAPLLKVLLAFASGGLLGDAFLHLIPHALVDHGDHGDHGGGHSHGHGHDDHSSSPHHDMTVGLWVLAGIFAFLLVEKSVRIAKGSSGSHGHSHSRSPAPVQQKDKKKEKEKESDERRRMNQMISHIINIMIIMISKRSVSLGT